MSIMRIWSTSSISRVEDKVLDGSSSESKSGSSQRGCNPGLHVSSMLQSPTHPVGVLRTPKDSQGLFKDSCRLLKTPEDSSKTPQDS